MDVEQSPVFKDDAEVKDETSSTAPPIAEVEAIEHGEQDLLHEENVDTVLTTKMALVNDVSLEDSPWPSPSTQA